MYWNSICLYSMYLSLLPVLSVSVCTCMYLYILYVGPCQVNKPRVNKCLICNCMYLYVFVCILPVLSVSVCICLYHRYMYVSVRICMDWFSNLKYSIFGANTYRYSIVLSIHTKYIPIHTDTVIHTDTYQVLTFSICMYLKMNTGRSSQILKRFPQYIQICTCKFADGMRQHSMRMCVPVGSL